LSFPRKRESSFFALDPCFRRGDIVGFRFPQQILNNCFCGIIALSDLLVFFGFIFFTGILPEQEDVAILFGVNLGQLFFCMTKNKHLQQNSGVNTI